MTVFRGLSLKDSANHAEFAIELSLKDNEIKHLIEKHGLTSPRIPTWFSTTHNFNGARNTTVIWKGPAEDVEVAKALIEEFYEGCTWSYGKLPRNQLNSSST